jgi:hypothetical protein
MAERHPAWVTGINDFEARLASGALLAAQRGGDQLDPLRVRSGIRDSPGYPGLVALSTNKVTVNPFQAAIQDPARPGIGAYLVTLDAPKELPLTAADPVLNRTDLVIAEIDEPASPGFTVRVVEGQRSSSATPQPPAVTNSLHLRLAQVFVRAAGATPTLSDLRQFTAALGGVLPVRTAADRPDTTQSSQLIYRLDIGAIEVLRGGGWTTYRPPRADTWHPVVFQNSWTNYGSPYPPAAYTLRDDGWVVLRGLIKSAATTDNIKTVFTLPTGYRPVYRHLFSVRAHITGTARLDVDPNGEVVSPYADTGLTTTWTSLDGVTFATY